MVELLRIWNIDTKPEHLAGVIRVLICNRDTVVVEDKADKIQVSIGNLLMTVYAGLNTETGMILDQEGYPQYPSRNQNDTYHTVDSWKARGLLNPGTDKYPSITGGGLYEDHILWEAAGERSRFKGSLLQEAQRKLWEYVGKKVDLAPYQPKGDHPCARMTALQKWFIDAQNLIYSNLHRTKESISIEIRVLPRTYEYSRAQFERIENLLGALEMGLGVPVGSQQGETMRSYVRTQISTEHMREFTSQGARIAITTALNDLAKEDERNPGGLTLEHVTSKILWAWRRVEADLREASSHMYPEPTPDPAAPGAGATNQRALVACAAQIVAENAAKKGPAHLEKAATEELIILRKDNANLKNEVNQLKSKVDAVYSATGLKGPAFKQNYGGGARQPYRGGGSRGSNRGGYGRDPRRSNFRGDKVQAKGEDDDSVDNEKGYFVRVGTEECVAFARCARVQSQSKGPAEIEKEAPETLKELPMEDYDREPEGVRTRSMVKSQSAKLGDSEMGSAPMEPEPTQPISLPGIPDEVDMEDWAWSAGGAELYPPNHQDAAWRRHAKNPTGTYWRVAGLMSQVGIRVEEQVKEESLLYMWTCPLPEEDGLPRTTVEIWGLEQHAYALRAYHEAMTESDLEERLARVQEINDARRFLRIKDEELVKFVKQENPRIFWEVAQERRAQNQLEKELEAVCVREKAVETFAAAFSSAVKAYMTRIGPYAWPEYKEEDTRGEMERYTAGKRARAAAARQGSSSPDSDLEAPEGITEGSDDVLEDADAGVDELVPATEGSDDVRRYNLDYGELGSVSVRVIPYGSKHSPLELMSLLPGVPGRVAPPEGYTVDMDDGGAGLPIPEGCSSTARPDGQDGQSHPGDC